MRTCASCHNLLKVAFGLLKKRRSDDFDCPPPVNLNFAGFLCVNTRVACTVRNSARFFCAS